MTALADLLRALGPQVLGVLVRRGADFASAEDAVQEALIEAVQRWGTDDSARMPDNPRAWLVTVAGRKYLDAQRSDIARRRRELRDHEEPEPGPVEQADDTLLLLFLACHPSLTPASAVALTLRAVGGLTTRQIAEAYLVPEATMAQRISRAKKTIGCVRLSEPGDPRLVSKVLYLIFNQGYGGEVDLAAEAIRLARQLAVGTDEPEVDGLLALMLLHHARRTTRRTTQGALIPLAEQDRSRWDSSLAAEGVDILRAALAKDRLGEYQAQAAIAALHADAQTAEETDWPQILSWYDELVRLTDSPVAALNRAVAVGEAEGPLAGLRALDAVSDDVPRHAAVRAHLTERAGDLTTARTLYAAAARAATNPAERDHLTKQAARLRPDPAHS
ncbi:MAG: sigma-70 family RNA polymerase sigma factor [Nostocoides sp.]